MNAAKEAVDRGMSVAKAAVAHDVPRSTLQRRVWGCCPLKAPLGPKRPVFTPSQESRLKDHILMMERDLSALTINSFGRKHKARTALATFYSRLTVIPPVTIHVLGCGNDPGRFRPFTAPTAHRARDKAEPNTSNRSA